jgi:hypothetical protein
MLMDCNTAKFIFQCNDIDKVPHSARAYHVRLLYDVLNVCLQRNDIPRARRAWCTLARGSDIDSRFIWESGLQIILRSQRTYETHSINYLRAMMFRHVENVSSSNA